MHVPDGFINAPVSAGTGAVAAVAVAVSLRGARRELSGGPGEAGERTAPLAGLVAAFIFAVQMLNFPVAAGTSGHLLGGALAAILVGPYTGVLCVSVVLLLQGVLFADGGLTALGVNITDMGVVTVLVAYGIFRGLLRLLPRARSSVTIASFVAALVSVPAAATAFTGIYALGGTTDVALGKVFAAMVGVHVLIGIGEAAITALTVGAVVAVRPDLVYAARDRLAVRLELRTSPLATPGAAARAASGPAPEPASAPESESAPDSAPASDSAPEPARNPSAPGAGPAPGPAPALRRAAGRSGRCGSPGSSSPCCARAGSASTPRPVPTGWRRSPPTTASTRRPKDHSAKDSPLADYGVKDISSARLSGGLAGIIGAGATLALGSGVFVVLRRRRAEPSSRRGSPVPAGRRPRSRAKSRSRPVRHGSGSGPPVGRLLGSLRRLRSTAER